MKLDCKEEVKLYSVELPSFGERRFEAPRDSVEPQHIGFFRSSDEIMSGHLRKTDELVQVLRFSGAQMSDFIPTRP